MVRFARRVPLRYEAHRGVEPSMVRFARRVPLRNEAHRGVEPSMVRFASLSSTLRPNPVA